MQEPSMSSARMKILVVDDEPTMREVLEELLPEWGYDLRTAADGLEGKAMAESYNPDIVLSDVVMPRLSGLDLLRELKAGEPSRPVILFTAQGSIDLAVEAMKHGAKDFLTKPLDYSKLKAVLAAAEQDIRAMRQSQKLTTQLSKGPGMGELVGGSKPMREIYALIESLSANDAPVLITGETGTGKELVASTIHRLSPRSEFPFVAINAAAIPESLMESELFGHEKGAFTGAIAVRAGCFELANRGTLFLDEIAEMPPALQPKLLRVLENGRVRRLGGQQELTFDVRIVAATNRDPRSAIQEGKLREDLYFRLNVFTVALPPLRERLEDIPLIAQHFILHFNAKHHAHVEAIRPEAQEMLRAYPWPGNVRELRNVMERAVIIAKGEWIEGTHLPPYIQRPETMSGADLKLPAGTSAAGGERELILRTLEQTGNNKAEAARRLGLDVKTIRNKLKLYSRKD
jgi:DNA-binding NtrC family response regulator